MSLSGIERGQGWRALPNTLAGDLPAVVRYLALDESRNAYRLLGSGTVIGVSEGRWLVTATARQSRSNRGRDDSIQISPTPIIG